MKLELVDKSSEQDRSDPFQTGEPKYTRYTGPERRSFIRRTHSDRREMLRFDLEKSDRREHKDRRAPKSVWDDRTL